MILYTADLHLGHAGIIGLDHRPFADVEEMDEYLIKRWNDRVQNDDEVYIVGDFCFRAKTDPVAYLRRMKGIKHLVVGNHDAKLLKNKTAMSYFKTVNDMAFITDGQTNIFMCHYPLAEWPGYFRGTVHIYAHIHNNTQHNAYKTMRREENALNAGCMINNFAPASLRELIDNNKAFKAAHNA